MIYTLYLGVSSGVNCYSYHKTNKQHRGVCRMLNNDEYQMLESGVGVDENNKKLPNYSLGRYSGVKGLRVS